MNFRLVLLTCLCMTAAAFAQTRPSEPSPLADLDQLRAQLKTDPAGVLRESSRLLALRGPAGKSIDRYEVLSLRGEAELRTKNNLAAGQSFAAAEHETTDAKKKAMARATSVLIRRSKPLGYVPRGKEGASANPPATMPIIEEADRKAAMKALLDDELTTEQAKVASAKKATTIPPIIDTLQSLEDLRAIESTATDGTKQTDTMARSLGGKAHELFDSSLKKMSDEVDRAEKHADRIIKNIDSNHNGHAYRAGMTSTDAEPLRDVVQTCLKIESAARQLATASGDEDLNQDAQKAREVFKKAAPHVEKFFGKAATQPSGGD